VVVVVAAVVAVVVVVVVAAAVAVVTALHVWMRAVAAAAAVIAAPALPWTVGSVRLAPRPAQAVTAASHRVEQGTLDPATRRASAAVAARHDCAL
jgi:hypothetical protein